MNRNRLVRTAVVGALAVSTCVISAASSAAHRPPPGLRMLAVVHRIQVDRYPKERITWFSPGVYIAATHGAFEIDVYRRSGGAKLWQVSRYAGQAHRIRAVTPIGAVRLPDGLPNFFRVALVNGAGTRVASAAVPFCPNGYLTARVSPDGPEQSTYPGDCGDALTRATVWGIDAGWGEEVSFGLRTGSIPDGAYTLTVAVANQYARQFGIPPTERSVTMRVKLTTGTTFKLAGTRRAQSRALGAPTSPMNNPLGGPGGVPDLRALPAHDLSITHTRNGHEYLNFAATIWNAGSGPLVLEGFRHGARPVMPATQFILRDGHVVAAYRAGHFEFDTRRGHDHWHMEQIARYDLLSGNGQHIVRSRKQSFCLAPTDAVNLTRPGTDWQPDQSKLWSACQGSDAIWIREVLPAGWGDTYYQSVAGQSFDITNLRDGMYEIRITADPPHELHETSYRDNTSILRFMLVGQTGDQAVVVR